MFVKLFFSYIQNTREALKPHAHGYLKMKNMPIISDLKCTGSSNVKQKLENHQNFSDVNLQKIKFVFD